MGSVISVLGPTRAMTWVVQDKDRFCDHDEPFVDMISRHSVYGSWMNAKTEFELKLVHCNLQGYLTSLLRLLPQI